jgi:hypothetical protein
VSVTFRDNDGTTRLAGELLIGGTTGDVATVQADGSLAPGGGSQPQTLTLDLTTDPDTFLINWEHDFGKVTPLFVSIVVLALDGDGETWGTGMGEISALISGPPGGFQAQRDDAPTVPGWTTLVSAFKVYSGSAIDTFDTVGQYAAFTYLCPQCLRFPPDAWGIVDENGDPYAGANHPTATVRLTVEYLG